jgi:hypothetical protein
MYQVVMERNAEKDLRRLSSEVRARTAVAMQALRMIPGLLAVGS